VSQPVFTAIAGANGSGKSTLTRSNRALFASIPILDPDALAQAIQVQAASPLAAGRQVLSIAEAHLRDHRSFAVETTLAGRNYLKMMQRARSQGYSIVLVYIGTQDVEINLLRIRHRVLTGGHDVPETDVRRRYTRSLSNLPEAISRADHSILLDNSTDEGYRVVALIDAGQQQRFSPVPHWAADSLH
jgi:predicted ABC-type ATPase